MTFDVRFVLVSPQSAENVGAAARALKNFGHRDWAIVSPRYPDESPAGRLAVHAADWLEAARRPATLDEAVADCAWVVATTSRALRGRRRLGPRAWATEAAGRLALGHVALVFGGERNGLSAAELERCQDLATVPVSREQPSLNLAQAVLLFAYELKLAREGKAAPRNLKLGATAAEGWRLGQTLTEVLSASGFLHDDGRHAVRDLLRPFERARLTRDEARLWEAALHAIRKAIERA